MGSGASFALGLADMHPALSVLVGLAVALLLNRWRVPLGLAFVAGAATITLGSGLGLTATGAAFGEVLGAPKTWAFAGQVTLVFVLSIVMKLAGGLDVLVEAAGALIRNRRARLARQSLPASHQPGDRQPKAGGEEAGAVEHTRTG